MLFEKHVHILALEMARPANQHCANYIGTVSLPVERRMVGDVRDRAYSKRVPRTNCALRIKKCAPRISSGINFLSTS